MAKKEETKEPVTETTEQVASAPESRPADRTPKATTETVRLGAKADPLPAGPLVNGAEVTDIPDEAAQRAGFETEHHHLLTHGGYGFKYVKSVAPGATEE